MQGVALTRVVLAWTSETVTLTSAAKMQTLPFAEQVAHPQPPRLLAAKGGCKDKETCDSPEGSHNDWM